MVEHVMPTYARLPVSFVKGNGAWLVTADGERYLDAISGIGVCSLGHAHPRVTDAICRQSETLLHTSNLYGIQQQEMLANKLCQLSGMDNVFFSNSGAEANEAAIKLARKYGHSLGYDIPQIIVMENSFHGRTLATLSATGNRKVQAGFEPLVAGFVRVPYNDIDSIKQIASQSNQVCAILVEPIQGEGGVNIPADTYLQQLSELCQQHNWLLMLDEIQTGIARTGQFFCFQHANIQPDVVTSAKALGNGVPIGACLARGKAAQIFTAGNHGSTFGGNPLACAAALAVLETIEDSKLIEKAQETGQALYQKFSDALAEIPSVKEIRHKGMMLAIELNAPCSDLVKQALERKLLINVTQNQVIRLLPPLIYTEQEVDYLVDNLVSIIKEFK